MLPDSTGTFKSESLLVSWEAHPDLELMILLPQHLKCWLWCLRFFFCFLGFFFFVCLFFEILDVPNTTAVNQPNKGELGGNVNRSNCIQDTAKQVCLTQSCLRTGLQTYPVSLRRLLLCHTYKTTRCLELPHFSTDPSECSREQLWFGNFSFLGFWGLN